ncbi:MAG: right-handed parallel beta-helix repeat-containing protein, partial [Chloroflexi bacterium]|nr:right-handed parallel beta-helix repeat-containing protein [Chloroflexota bacterium]
VTIDGYTQPGSQPNTATVGSNAIPGVEIRGNGSSARETAFRITSAGNTFRGLLIDNVYRGIFIDTAGGTDNRIVGNWIGFHSDGSNAAPGNFAIVLNTGAVRNQVGTSALADKNVIGNYTHAVDEYGPGTNGNVIQGNQFCIGPTGFTLATCSSAVDHNFGPKNGLIGGTGAERNVIGPTALQGIEFSHGYNPSGPPGSDQSVTYQINGHRVAGNWVGFRGDGSYDALYRSGLSDPGSADNGQAINVYDGSNDNIVEGNWVGSVYDGIQVMSPNSQRNTVRDNIIGVSPLGEPAPLTRWGIRLRIGTKSNVIRGNTIRNAGLGGVGLTQGNVYNIRISRNIVTDTSGIGIDLFGASGPEPNDAGDGDSGANTLLNTPVITTANASTIAGTASGNATVEVFRASRPAGENGLPTEFLGSTTAASNGTWSLAVASTVGDRVTALQFRADDNTSELSTNVEVVAGPAPPQPGDLLAADDFERTVSAGWGDAPTGGSWTHRGAQSDFSVADGAGRISVAAGQSREGRLAVAAADVTVTGKVSFDRLPGTGGFFAYALARANGNDSYRASIRVSTSGAVFVQLKRAINNVETNLAAEVATGLTLAAGTALAFRLEVVGTQLRFRVWHPGGAEPTTWHVTATDSTAALQGAGSAGLRAYVGSSVPNGPAVISPDDFEVRRG